MSFKLPSLRSLKPTPETSGLHVFSKSELVLGQEIGRGSFGSTVMAKLTAGKSVEQRSTVVVKKVMRMNDYERKRFLKEARIFFSLDNANIIGFRGVYEHFSMIILDYSVFDFKPFSIEDQVHNLQEFVSVIDNYSCEGFVKATKHAAKDIASGMTYLHSKKIVHRDLKPSNIPVSNQHYTELGLEEIPEAFNSRPIVCKLTDFGESRSSQMQTQTALLSRTSTIERGTVVYMAPELFVAGLKLNEASISDLMIADIWALGMMFTLTNPDKRYPFSDEMAHARDPDTFPSMSSKYEPHRAGVWSELVTAFEKCVKFDRHARFQSHAVLDIFVNKPAMMLSHRNLRVSQSSAVTDQDALLAKRCSLRPLSSIDSEILQVPVINDGTNACSFLSVKIVTEIMQNIDTKNNANDLLDVIADLVENIIIHLPLEINLYHCIGKLHDVLEAKKLLEELNQIDRFAITEELPFGDTVYSSSRKAHLVDKLCDLAKGDFLGIFTCCPFVLVLRCLGGRPIIIDTHLVCEKLGGNGNGVLQMYKDSSKPSFKEMCEWLWERLHNGGCSVSETQSLSLLVHMKDSIVDHGAYSDAVGQDDVVHKMTW